MDAICIQPPSVKEKRKNTIRTAIIFSLIPIIFGIGQSTFPDAPMYSLGFVCASITIYAFNISAQRDEFFEERFNQQDKKHSSIISGLAENYDVIYYVNLDTNEYETYSNHNEEGRLSLECVNKGKDFFNDVPKHMDGLIYMEDKELFKEKTSRKNVMAELSEKEGFVFTFRAFSVSKNSVRYYQTKCIRSSVIGEENKIIVGTACVDEQVREEMEYREMLERAQKQAESASEAKSSFLFNMSHDIRTPMNAILGFTAIARRNVWDQNRVEDCLSKINLAGQHLLKLINEVLDMSRIESGKAKVVFSEENIRELGDFIISVMGKSAKDGQLEDERIDYAKYRFIISDTGIGMSEEYLKHIFESFSRAETATISGIEGTGLGMAITKKLIDLLDGTIDITSELNKGTTMTIIIPMKIVEGIKEGDGKEADFESATFDFSGKRLLLVEDNELNMEIAQDLLEECGFEIDTARNGAEAVNKVSGVSEGYYNLILMDIQMPKLNGYEATSLIRALDNKKLACIPIIAMTVNAFEEDKKAALDAGMNDHIAKPLNMHELLQAISKYML